MGYQFIKIAVFVFLISISAGILESSAMFANSTVSYYEDINSSFPTLNMTDEEADSQSFTQGNWLWGATQAFGTLGKFTKAVSMPGSLMNDAGFPAWIGNYLTTGIWIVYALALIQFVANRRVED